MSQAGCEVRFTLDFFLDLARQLTERRGPARQPSRIDFETHDLQMIAGRFAADWDDLPELIPGHADYRVLISVGVLVRDLAAEGQLASDGAGRTGPAQHRHQLARRDY